MFIRFTHVNGTHIWLRADRIFSVEKQSNNKLQTVVQIAPGQGYEAVESQEDIIVAISLAMKTGEVQVTKESAPENPTPRRLIS